MRRTKTDMRRVVFALLVCVTLLSGCEEAQAEPARETEQETAGETDGESATEAVGSIRTDRDVEIAAELLTEAAEVRERIDAGMTLLYTGEEAVIDGRDCMLFALGTEHEEQFVREYLYGVCDNLIYAYDALADAWSPLGMG